MFPTLETMLADLPPGFYLAMLVTCIALVPPAVILRARAVPSESRRIHLIQNMDNQPKFVDQQENILFLDTRSMRPPVPGAVSLNQMVDDTHLHLGTIDGNFATTFPDDIKVDQAGSRQGVVQIFLPCHGVQGFGNGPVHERAMVLLNTGTNGTTWVQQEPARGSDRRLSAWPDLLGHQQRRTQHGYKSQILTEDRWVIVAWVEAAAVTECSGGQGRGADAYRSSRPRLDRRMSREAHRPVQGCSAPGFVRRRAVFVATGLLGRRTGRGLRHRLERRRISS